MGGAAAAARWFEVWGRACVVLLKCARVTYMRADAARTGWANSTWTNKNSGLVHAPLISFSGTNIVRTSLRAVTLDRLATGACSSKA